MGWAGVGRTKRKEKENQSCPLARAISCKPHSEIMPE
jgi:hypothetical protein